MRNFYNSEVIKLKEELKSQIVKTNDKVIKIKLEEVSKLIHELGKTDKMKTDNLVDLLQYHTLLEELSKANERV